MSDVGTPALTVLRPGDGEARDLGTIGVVFKLFGEQTNGQVSVVEHPFPVGACVPPHMHTREDEYSIVTEGDIGFRSGDREVVLGAGGYITKPRGETHTMWNAGRVPARMIEIISPAGFEHFFWGVTELASTGPPDPESIAALAAEWTCLRQRTVAGGRHRALWPDAASRPQLSKVRRRILFRPVVCWFTPGPYEMVMTGGPER